MAITQLIPVLACTDIKAEHDFLVRVFGFTAGRIDKMPDGTVVHGEVHAGALSIWLHREADDHKLAAARNMPMQPGGLVVHVDDVDAHHAHALKCGADVERAPQDQPYGQREYAARCAEGHRWWFATPFKT
jgi:uncharacterized glyoxalase superfamily protein PhnB